VESAAALEKIPAVVDRALGEWRQRQQRRRDEAELRQSERLLVESQRVARLGYRTGELEGRSFFDLVHPDDLDATRAATRELGARKQVLDFTNRFRARDRSSSASIAWWQRSRASWQGDTERKPGRARPVSEVR
jgi:PAS domain-containing protein